MRKSKQIISSALLESYAQKNVLSEDDIIKQQELTIPLSRTKEDELFALREWARERCRPATPDSMVAQMLESEDRHGGIENKRAPLKKPVIVGSNSPNGGQLNAGSH